jgi:hypothetical protein
MSRGGHAPRWRRCVLQWKFSPSAPYLASAAYLKFLHHKRRFDPGTSNRKAALESIGLLVPIIFRSSWKWVLQRNTNFGKWALEVLPISKGRQRPSRRCERHPATSPKYSDGPAPQRPVSRPPWNRAANRTSFAGIPDRSRERR